MVIKKLIDTQKKVSSEEQARLQAARKAWCNQTNAWQQYMNESEEDHIIRIDEMFTKKDN